MTDDFLLLKNDFDHFLNRLYDAETKAKAGQKNIDLKTLEPQISHLCSKVDKLPPTQARQFSARMNEMIECLNRLETILKTSHD